MIFEEDTGFGMQANLKVIGVGGAGGNAVEHMIESKVEGVEFICANTDAQDLNRSTADIKIPLGQRLTKGRGAGARPEIGREAAEESKDQIRDTLAGAEMLFVTAGMGGGTGTGASPLIAEIARDMGILTVAVVTLPFTWEMGRKKQHAMAGIEELSRNVDSIITIPNDKLNDLGEDIGFLDAYKEADKVLKGAVQGIADLVTKNGFVNVDFADVTTVMSENGQAMMGTGEAEGENRAEVAARNAISSPLLDNMDLKDARGLLVNITSGSNYKMSEHEQIGHIVREITSDDATVVIGNVIDDSMGDRITVTVVATGLGKEVGRISPRKPKLEAISGRSRAQATGTHGPQYDLPKSSSNNSGMTGGGEGGGDEYLDIPAFLRNQMD
jgi:cell division protein FtsZ